MISFTSDQWVILALVFVLGFLIGAFLVAGSGRKWKHRYRHEVHRREEIDPDNFGADPVGPYRGHRFLLDQVRHELAHRQRDEHDQGDDQRRAALRVAACRLHCASRTALGLTRRIALV